MRKTVSIFLLLALSISLFAGCAMGIGDNPMPTQPTKPVTQPEDTQPQSPDAITIVGLFYRTEAGGAMLLSQDIGPLVLHNNVEEFVNIQDFAIIKAETEVIMESYPAQTTIKNWDVTNTATIVDEWKDMVNEMKSMGYIPAEPFGEEEPPVIELSSSPYDAYAKIMDNTQLDNILFSPLSLNFALGMLSNSAGDNALAMFEEYFGMSTAEYNQFIKDYIDNAQPARGNTSVEIANGIWVQNDFTLMEKFQQNMQNMYYADTKACEFNNNLVEEINQWCALKTHDMIPSILDNIPADAVSILANALYFDAEWMKPYEEHQVKEENFTATDGTISTVEGLHETSELPYYENDHAVAFSKYYSDGRYSFVGILPKEEGEFTIESLDLESLMASQSEETYEVVSMVPKFKFDNAHEMLPLLNYADLPVDSYEYPNMVNETTLGVDRIIQKTAIELTESGTTAAAVTVVMMKNEMMAIDPEEEIEQKEVILNRPFAFMIYDNEIDIPLFIGKVTTL